MPPAVVIALRVTDLHGQTRELAWPDAKLQIGSHPGSGLLLQGRGVSDYHCVLERVRDRYVLRDRGSRAGTFVDSERLTEPRDLVPGARIYIGEYQLELLDPPAPREPTAPVPVLPAPPRARRVPLVGGLLALGALLGLGAAARAWLPASEPPPPPPAPVADAPPATEPAPAPAPPDARRRTVLVRHEVAPGETILDIATRYGVSPARLIADHGLHPDLPPEPGQVLSFRAVDPPLPRLRLDYVVAPGDTWTRISERFDVGIEHLRRANPEHGDAPRPGDTLRVWVDPQIELRRDEVVRTTFSIPPGARSVGAPNAGKLESGIQLPPSPLYERVHPRLQYGSSHTLRHLLWAIARFRQLYRYEGVLVLSDLSREGGGELRPHKSHQSGRDIDIWLPPLKGTYLPLDLTLERKPIPDQVNWYAAWGLVESLLATGQVEYIFLDRSLHPRLYDAALRMGADPELRAEIQVQPDDQDPELVAHARLRATIRHADDHRGHIHVRFLCEPAEDRCAHRDAGDDP